MKSLDIEINTISNLALEVVKRVIAENEKTNKIKEDDSGPLAVASALSDFFQVAASIEDRPELDSEVISEFGHQGMDLLDRISFQLRELDIVDQRDNLARVYAALAVWLARREAILDNLQGTAEGFANLVNAENDPPGLIQLCHLMEEVIQAASDSIKIDEDRSNPWRPWRVLNLNSGIAATRALEPDLMKKVFEELGRHLPYDMPGFFADGKRQMLAQNVPQPVRDVMSEYAEKWPANSPH